MQKVQLKWLSFDGDMKDLFSHLRESEELTDVVLSNGLKSIKCHKVVLSCASKRLHNLLKEYSGRDLVIYLGGVNTGDMLSLVNFMYTGVVDVPQLRLCEFLALAKQWGVRGLGVDGTNSDDQPRDDSAALSSDASQHRQPSVDVSQHRQPSVDASQHRQPSVDASQRRQPSLDASQHRQPSLDASQPSQPSLNASQPRQPPTADSRKPAHAPEVSVDSHSSKGEDTNSTQRPLPTTSGNTTAPASKPVSVVSSSAAPTSKARRCGSSMTVVPVTPPQSTVLPAQMAGGSGVPSGAAAAQPQPQNTPPASNATTTTAVATTTTANVHQGANIGSGGKRKDTGDGSSINTPSGSEVQTAVSEKRRKKNPGASVTLTTCGGSKRIPDMFACPHCPRIFIRPGCFRRHKARKHADGTPIARNRVIMSQGDPTAAPTLASGTLTLRAPKKKRRTDGGGSADQSRTDGGEAAAQQSQEAPETGQPDEHAMAAARASAVMSATARAAAEQDSSSDSSDTETATQPAGSPWPSVAAPSTARGATFAARGAPSSARGVTSATRVAPSAARGVTSATRGATSTARGAPSTARGAPSDANGDHSAPRSTPSAARGTPSAARATSSLARGASSAGRGPPPAAREAASAASGGQKSPSGGTSWHDSSQRSYNVASTVQAQSGNNASASPVRTVQQQQAAIEPNGASVTLNVEEDEVLVVKSIVSMGNQGSARGQDTKYQGMDSPRDIPSVAVAPSRQRSSSETLVDGSTSRGTVSSENGQSLVAHARSRESGRPQNGLHFPALPLGSARTPFEDNWPQQAPRPPRPERARSIESPPPRDGSNCSNDEGGNHRARPWATGSRRDRGGGERNLVGIDDVRDGIIVDKYGTPRLLSSVGNPRTDWDRGRAGRSGGKARGHNGAGGSGRGRVHATRYVRVRDEFRNFGDFV